MSSASWKLLDQDDKPKKDEINRLKDRNLVENKQSNKLCDVLRILIKWMDQNTIEKVGKDELKCWKLKKSNQKKFQWRQIILECNGR